MNTSFTSDESGTQMTISHQDMWSGKLVTSPYKRVNLATESSAPSAAERREYVSEFIPISNSLGKETALVNVKRGRKRQRVTCLIVGTRLFVCIVNAPLRSL